MTTPVNPSPVVDVVKTVEDEISHPKESVAERIVTAFEDLAPEIQDFLSFVARHLGVEPPVSQDSKPAAPPEPPPAPTPVWNAATGKWELPA